MTTQRKRRGFGYIDVLAAMLVMSFGLLALVPLFAMGMKVNGAARDLTVANALAKEKLEQLGACPTTDPRLAIPAGASKADETNRTFCANDLPRWQKPATGETSAQVAHPGNGWYRFPYRRTYTVQAFPIGLAAPVASAATDESIYSAANGPAPYYAMKLVTVTVVPVDAALPGLRMTRQSAYVRFRNASGI